VELGILLFASTERLDWRYFLTGVTRLAMEAESFADLWQRYRTGETAARSQLLASFVPRIVGLARKLLRNQVPEEDLAQSVFVSFLANHAEEFGAVQEPGELWSLFAAITVRHCNKHRKRASRVNRRGPVASVGAKPQGGGDDSHPGYEPVDDELPPDVQVAVADFFEQCNALLSERQQRVLGMHLMGADRKETAEALQVAIPTVDRELKRIRTVLAQMADEA
jgi:RNA polymerase sigma factor (sigma-70 family)